jgi:hypothetical protein
MLSNVSTATAKPTPNVTRNATSTVKPLSQSIILNYYYFYLITAQLILISHSRSLLGIHHPHRQKGIMPNIFFTPENLVLAFPLLAVCSTYVRV